MLDGYIYNALRTPFGRHAGALARMRPDDMLAAVILGNMFGRFPQLRVLVLEYGSRWVYELLPGMDKAVKMGANGTWPGGMFEDAPSDIFKEHVWVSPFPEDDVVALAAVLPTNRIVFGSDFPLIQPDRWLHDFAALDIKDDVRPLVLKENALRMLGVKH